MFGVSMSKFALSSSYVRVVDCSRDGEFGGSGQIVEGRVAGDVDWRAGESTH